MNPMIKKLIKASFYLPGGSHRMVKYLRKIGIEIGSDLRLYDAPSIVIDETRPYLIRIGNSVRITHGVVILTHDFSKTVLINKYGEEIGDGAPTIIGNNCFIGNNAVILMGSHIGDNVIIGAGSVVKGEIPADVVVAGNPAKVICTLDEQLKKGKKRAPANALRVAKRYFEIFGKMPNEYDMRYFRSCWDCKNSSSVEGELQSWDCFEDFLSDVSKECYEIKD